MDDMNNKSLLFQQRIVETFNDNEIPFLLRYYLLEEIWRSVQIQKEKIDAEFWQQQKVNEQISK